MILKSNKIEQRLRKEGWKYQAPAMYENASTIMHQQLSALVGIEVEDCAQNEKSPSMMLHFYDDLESISVELTGSRPQDDSAKDPRWLKFTLFTYSYGEIEEALSSALTLARLWNAYILGHQPVVTVTTSVRQADGSTSRPHTHGAKARVLGDPTIIEAGRNPYMGIAYCSQECFFASEGHHSDPEDISGQPFDGMLECYMCEKELTEEIR